MNSRNIKLVLSYDGTDFGGWQRQANARSVQEELESALAKMHGHAVPTVGAGRTDSGVHALGQVASFYTDIRSIPAVRFLPALNKLLPQDLRVLSAEDADFDFHARHDARLRRYRYFCACGAAVDPFRLRYAHRLIRRPVLESLNAMARLIPGERDFTSFSAAKDPSANRSRYVHESSWAWEGESLVFQVAANAFLWRMVRSLVGSMLFWESEIHAEGLRGVSAAERCAARMASALDRPDRGLAGPTAPAKGLFFWNVEYYPRPTRPGRGDYWAKRREGEGESKAGGEDVEAGLEGRRLVPGVGFIEE